MKFSKTLFSVTSGILLCAALYLFMLYILQEDGYKGALIGPPQTTVRPAARNLNYLLPSDVIPKHYVIEIQPHLFSSPEAFNGTVKILIASIRGTEVITLHSKDLDIKSNIVVTEAAEGESITVTGKSYDDENNFLTVHLAEKLNVGKKYWIHFEFNGTLKHHSEGFFTYKYENEYGRIEYVAATQFQPSYARSAFPCFDEPALKATFDVTVVRPRKMISLSNMPRVNMICRGEWQADIYRTSMTMSTYLVAFVVGNFVAKKDGKVSMWAERQDAELTNYGLKISSTLLKFLERRLGVPYEAPKLDMILLRKMSSQGMENWGMITLKREIILYNETGGHKNPAAENLIAHEIAHQWFGNLVTPKWWSQLWLSEGISTYVGQVGEQELFWKGTEVDYTLRKAYTSFLISECIGHSSILSENYLAAGSNLFRAAVYDKGAMIIRMAHNIVGNESFWKAINSYLRRNAYGVVEEKDLWQILNVANSTLEEAGVNITKIMTPWTHQSGIPILTVNRNYSQGTATFVQSSCRPNSSDLWHIPVSYSTANSTEVEPDIRLWLQGKSETISINASADQWILVNGENDWYYIVNYDEKNWRLLAEELIQNREAFSDRQYDKIRTDLSFLKRLEKIANDICSVFYDNLHFCY